jgi:transposase
MSGKRYTEEFKAEAVKQVTERGHPVAEVASRLGVTTHSLYEWLRKYSVSAPERQVSQSQGAEIRKLKAELKRVTEERDILKKAAVGSTGQRNDSASLSIGVIKASVFLGRVFNLRAMVLSSACEYADRSVPSGRY